MKKEYDFSKGNKIDSKRLDSSPKIMISLRLDPHLVALLRDEADAIGIGYQTLIGDILKKHIEPEKQSFEDKIFQRLLKHLKEAGVDLRPAKEKQKKKKSA